ncbi:hypothetical protein SUGI_1193160 [Cryptomeria japonica]|nr:hypothetical protein SUGI_1193160 [Cryptomeria japonica]
MIFSRDHVNERPGWICLVVIAMLPPFFYLAIWASVQITLIQIAHPTTALVPWEKKSGLSYLAHLHDLPSGLSKNFQTFIGDGSLLRE